MQSRQLRDDARAIWSAGVDAVRSEPLTRSVIRIDGHVLRICQHALPLESLERIVVVGAGKAGAGMAAGVEQALGRDFLQRRVSGWVNVPADCVRPLQKIHLHAARPAGVNEPTEQGVAGTRRILELVRQCGPHDLCLVLISGGGSALLPAPKRPLNVADKQAVTRFLMNSGATIHQLNAVRKRLSDVKGGGLARACRAGRLIALIISDVVGDPLDVIASGPTYPDNTTNAEALAIVKQFGAAGPEVPQAVFDLLESGEEGPGDAADHVGSPAAEVSNEIIANNHTALTASGQKAEQLGYRTIWQGCENCGEANEEGRRLAQFCLQLRDGERISEQPACVLGGGEPVVRLAATDRPRKGGRNQQLVLAAVEALQDDRMRRLAILSGGTDGEDGPTDAAGAVADEALVQRMRQLGLDPRAYLEINDAYGFFQQVHGLIKTGPTHTNVMDVRVALVAGPAR